MFQFRNMGLDGGKEYTEETQKTIVELCKPFWVAGLSVLGGEPLNQRNISDVTSLARKFKKEYPDKTLWLWTGYLFEDVKDIPVMEYIDVLIDGQYVDELHDFRLHWKGSSNQRVIDVQKSLKDGKVIIYEDKA